MPRKLLISTERTEVGQSHLDTYKFSNASRLVMMIKQLSRARPVIYGKSRFNE